MCIRDRVGRRLHADLLPDLIRGHTLVAGELVRHLSDLIDSHQLEGISEEQDGLLLRPSSFCEEFPLDLINRCV